MVWTGVLRAAFLLSLLSSGIWEAECQDPVNHEALEQIISVINLHGPKSQSASVQRSPSASVAIGRSAPRPGSPSAPVPIGRSASVRAPGPDHIEDFQYAMAIRVAKGHCLGLGLGKEGLKSLIEEVSEVKKEFNKASTLYKGKTVIAAKPEKRNIHSEYRLLIENDQSLIKELLGTANGKPDDCVIFYTYNSPCCDLCLNEEKDKGKQKQYDNQMKKKGTAAPLMLKCVYNYLGVLNSLSGPRAFVFTKLYREDLKIKDNKPKDEVKTRLINGLKKVTETEGGTERIPLYQCDNNGCKRCEENNNYCVSDRGFTHVGAGNNKHG